MMRRGLLLALGILTVASAAHAQPVTASARWRQYDVNNDRRFDEVDMKAIVANGFGSPTVDANGDGARNVDDVWKLSIDKTTFDRNADGVVDAKDGVAAPAVVLPSNPAADIPRLVQDLLQRHAAAVPAAALQQMRAQLPYLTSTNRDTLSYGWLQAGAQVLLGRGLDAATWFHAKAVEATPDSAGPLAALGFALIEQGDLSAASIVLARAHQQKPLLCVVNSNVGMLHTRLGRPDQALPYYREAVRQCPRSSADRRTLATALLRAGHPGEAKIQYERAAQLDPHDAEAALMSLATNPPSPGADAAREGEYESLRRSHEDWRDRPAWRALEPEMKVDALLEMTEIGPSRELGRHMTALVDRTNIAITQAAKRSLPEGKDMCKDLERWMANWQKSVEEIQQLKADAATESHAAAVKANRTIGGLRLSLNSLLHQWALPVATQRRALYGGNTYEETLDQLWRLHMHDAEQRLRSNDPLSPYGDVPELDPDNAINAVMLSFMAITAGALDPTYLGAGECAGGKQKPMEPPQIQGDLAVGLSGGILAVEFKPRTCEIKFTQGEGLIMYETWSPANGFGMALGTGFQAPSGFVIEGGASDVVKFGSDGSIQHETSIQAGAGGVTYGVDVTETLVPKQMEPTGTNDFIKGVAKDLGCDVS